MDENAGSAAELSGPFSSDSSPDAAVTIHPAFKELRLKDTRASDSMLPPNGSAYECPWAEDSITIHADGNVSCGLDDPHAKRSFGNVYEKSIAEIYANPEFDKIRANLQEGRRCKGCNLFQPRGLADAVERKRAPLPATIVVETTVKCNLRCDNVACNPNNAPGLLTRHRSHLDLAKFTAIVDELKDGLRTVHFFNYGEPFLHPQAEDMLLYLRAACPGVRIVTSTNGIPLAKSSRAEKVVLSKIDRMTFTIGGIRQESYGRYHANGQVGLALQGLQNICEFKARHGTTKPKVVWRYLLFRWNDSEQEIDAAIALSKLYGVNQFCLYLTHIPAGGSSYRLAPGSPLYDKYRNYIDFVHGFDSVFPGESGFYGVENIAGLGKARWSSWRAGMRIPRHGNCLSLSLSTNRPAKTCSKPECIVRVPWMAVRVPLKRMEWTNVFIPIPSDMRDMNDFDVEFLTPDPWFPVEETANRDLRCLGVLVKEKPDSETDYPDFVGDPGFVSLSSDEVQALGAFGDRMPPRRPQNNSGRSGY